MKNHFLLLMLLLIISGSAVCEEKVSGKFYVFKDGKAMTSIVMPENASSNMKKAVKEFRKDLQKGYQVDIPIDDAPNLPGRIELVVENRTLETEDNTEIIFPSDDVMRITGGESGVIRSLFFLLEEFGGVRYLYHGKHGTHFPAATELAIPLKPIRHNSCFPLGRATSRTHHPTYFWPWEVKLGAKTRLFFNHDLSKVAFPMRKYCESEIKPDDKIFPILKGVRYLPYKHPAGKSRFNWRSSWQPCYSSPKSADEAVKNIIAYLKENPQTKSLSLGVNDGGGFCECDACLKLDKGGILNGRGHRSESYYSWVNQVVGLVAKQFPDVRFGLLAYREVTEPPSFKLHPNVVPYICFDLHAWADAKVKAKRGKIICAWSEKCDKLGFWAYDVGCTHYMLPRIYFNAQRDMMKFYHDHKVVAAFNERAPFTFNEGPKIYLYFKLLENPDLDLEKVLDDWYVACVGEAAAPFLRKYYDFWNDYWQTKATKTSWWQSRNSVYLMLAGFGTYMYGLEPDDMRHCRQLMEKVVELAEKSGTPGQKVRAQMQMKCFEWAEAAATACGAEIFSADAKLPNVAAAAKWVRSIPNATKSLEKWKHIMARDPLTRAEPWHLGESRSKIGNGMILNGLLAAGEYMADPAVKEAVGNLSKNNDLPLNIRFVAENMLKGGGDNPDNLAADGGFEKGGDDGWTAGWMPSHFVNGKSVFGKVGRVEGVSCNGKGSLKCEINHQNFHAAKVVLGTKPKTSYFFSARIFIPTNQPPSLEGRLQFWGLPTFDKGAKNLTWLNSPEMRLSTGKWNYVTAIVPGAGGADSIRLFIRLYNFEPGAVVYVDDVQLVELPNKASDNEGNK